MELNEKETILITGATGLVGAQIVRAVQATGVKVIGLARNIPLKADASVEWVSCDLLDVVQLEALLKGVDKVYHCAGLVSFDPSRRRELYKINFEGTANLINACILNGVKKLLHVSSVAAIGEAKGKDKVINEALDWNEEGASDYGKSKHLAEMEVWRGICEGLPAIIINPSIILGAGNWEEGSTAIFKSVYDEFPWYTEGVHGFVDIADVARIAVQLMNSELNAERYIVNGINCSYNQLFTQIANAFGKKPPHKKVTKFLAEFVWRYKYIKGKLTGRPSILNKNTARTALAIIEYDSEKLHKALPDFRYTSVGSTVNRVCLELKNKYQF